MSFHHQYYVLSPSVVREHLVLSPSVVREHFVLSPSILSPFTISCQGTLCPMSFHHQLSRSTLSFHHQLSGNTFVLSPSILSPFTISYQGTRCPLTICFQGKLSFCHQFPVASPSLAIGSCFFVRFCGSKSNNLEYLLMTALLDGMENSAVIIAMLMIMIVIATVDD